MIIALSIIVIIGVVICLGTSDPENFHKKRKTSEDLKEKYAWFDYAISYSIPAATIKSL